MGYITQSRFRSKFAWISLATLILFILKTYFGIEIPQIDKLLELTLAVVTAFGIFNNPESRDKY